ncbi:WSC domain-containing protein [Paramyrothecium foliicola]|nr:WSC domain-containing protein [Paramyrothecium foliicola]
MYTSQPAAPVFPGGLCSSRLSHCRFLPPRHTFAAKRHLTHKSRAPPFVQLAIPPPAITPPSITHRPGPRNSAAMRAHLQSACLLLALLALVVSVTAQAADGSGVEIWNDSDKYEYYGCYNETTEIEGSAQTRALGDGINEVKKGEMTVPMCLAFCSGGRTEYRYAGLQWSRECWCGQVLAGISAKLDDDQCSFPCDGDNSTACGGSLKLSVYRLGSAANAMSISTIWAASGIILALAIHSY